MSERTRSKEVEGMEKRLAANFHHDPTPGQEQLIYALSRFTMSKRPHCALIIRGYAGTGKTTTIGAYVRTAKEIRQKIVLLAPTGRAAKVIEHYSKKPASTIHRMIYFPGKTSGGLPSFRLGTNKYTNTVFIVDEASMIGEGGGAKKGRSLLDDLFEFVFSGTNCKLILVGDDAQLPPIGTDESPALKEDGLRTSFGLTIATVYLKDVMRQALNSEILTNANRLRLQIAAGVNGFPELRMGGGGDLQRLVGLELQDKIESLFDRFGEKGTVIITRSNKRAQAFNMEVRTRLLERENDLDVGDRLMVVKNNYYWLDEQSDIPTDLIANGDALEVRRIIKRFERYGHPFAEAVLKLEDFQDAPEFEATINLALLSQDAGSIPIDEQRALFHAVEEDYSHLGTKTRIRRAVMEDSCYQALQVKFAWSLTCHKAQGGQWPAVIVDQGYLTEEMLDRSLLRWMYTAFTRAQQELYLLNFSDAFFAGKS
jgi:exodeoxyribonuclease V